jgi:hypothetical protein
LFWQEKLVKKRRGIIYQNVIYQIGRRYHDL